MPSKSPTTIPPPSSSHGGVFSQPPPPTPPTRPNRLAAGPPPRLSGYEIVGELGRGGMGVVYKARQVGLNRVVALKMILGGVHAGPHELGRFRREAEAIARLQHPNIVQIYEVGEHEGRPYFSLEYVDGGSLDRRVNGAPQPPHVAAAVVQILARAIHATHQRGIVHRDLKPSNVLLTADNVLKITDFGVAKRLDPEDGGPVGNDTLTGTPSYMAPEQADGKQPVGPAADVYALGTILYELLTGRPPFRAETVLDTINQLVSLEPVPPRQLQPKVPRDLETICLKCLQKEPYRRYATAEALADDLQRFLKREPIAARPVGTLARAWRWCRRRPKVASLMGALVFLVAAGFPAVTLLWRRAEENRALAEVHRHRAEANFDRAGRAVSRLFGGVSDEVLLREPGLGPFRHKLVEIAREFQEQYLRERGDDSSIREDLGRALLRLARLSADLDPTSEAIALAGDAEALFARLAEEYPAEEMYRSELVHCQHLLGGLYLRAGRPDRAQAAYEEALAGAEELARRRPDEPRYQADQARCHCGLAQVCSVGGQADRTEALFKQALATLQELTRAHSQEAEYQCDLAETYAGLGDTSLRRGQPAQAEEAYRTALKLQTRLVQDHPKMARYAQDLAHSHAGLGAVYVQGRRPANALTEYQQARAGWERLAGQYPAMMSFRVEWAATCARLAELYTAAGDETQADEARRRAAALQATLAEHEK
jgi:serine/threonine-protein kinase